jgi:hypothetical protein
MMRRATGWLGVPASAASASPSSFVAWPWCSCAETEEDEVTKKMSEWYKRAGSLPEPSLDAVTKSLRYSRGPEYVGFRDGETAHPYNGAYVVVARGIATTIRAQSLTYFRTGQLFGDLSEIARDLRPRVELAWLELSYRNTRLFELDAQTYVAFTADEATVTVADDVVRERAVRTFSLRIKVTRERLEYMRIFTWVRTVTADADGVYGAAELAYADWRGHLATYFDPARPVVSASTWARHIAYRTEYEETLAGR